LRQDNVSNNSQDPIFLDWKLNEGFLNGIPNSEYFKPSVCVHNYLFDTYVDLFGVTDGKNTIFSNSVKFSNSFNDWTYPLYPNGRAVSVTPNVRVTDPKVIELYFRYQYRNFYVSRLIDNFRSPKVLVSKIPSKI